MTSMCLQWPCLFLVTCIGDLRTPGRAYTSVRIHQSLHSQCTPMIRKQTVVWRESCFWIFLINYLNFGCQLYFNRLLPVIPLPTVIVLHLSLYSVSWRQVACGKFQSVYFSGKLKVHTEKIIPLEHFNEADLLNVATSSID